MAAIDFFPLLYDNWSGSKSQDSCSVSEHAEQATLRSLKIHKTGARFLQYEQDLVKSVPNNTTRMSSILEDLDCDGISFFIDQKNEEHIIFAELKSAFDTKKITYAFHQIIQSFLKMNMWLSNCKDYDLHTIHLHFIVACQTFKDDNQKNTVLHMISQSQMIQRNTLEGKFLYDLLHKGYKSVSLSDFEDIRKLPFHDAITNKLVTIYLQRTANYGDFDVSITL